MLNDPVTRLKAAQKNQGCYEIAFSPAGVKHVRCKDERAEISKDLEECQQSCVGIDAESRPCSCVVDGFQPCRSQAVRRRNPRNKRARQRKQLEADPQDKYEWPHRQRKVYPAAAFLPPEEKNHGDEDKNFNQRISERLHSAESQRSANENQSQHNFELFCHQE